MGGEWRHRKDHTKHKRARAAALAAFREGQPCVRCGVPLFSTDSIHLDHNDDGRGYRGLAHAHCNTSAGGKVGAAIRNGSTHSRKRLCVICGRPYTAAMPQQVTCGQRSCITAIRRSRKDHHPDPEPPQAEGWVW